MFDQLADPTGTSSVLSTVCPYLEPLPMSGAASMDLVQLHWLWTEEAVGSDLHTCMQPEGRFLTWHTITCSRAFTASITATCRSRRVRALTRSVTPILLGPPGLIWSAQMAQVKGSAGDCQEMTRLGSIYALLLRLPAALGKHVDAGHRHKLRFKREAPRDP